MAIQDLNSVMMKALNLYRGEGSVPIPLLDQIAAEGRSGRRDAGAGHAQTLKASALIGAERFWECLLLLESTMAENPGAIDLFVDCQNLMATIMFEVEKKLVQDPLLPDFGAIYDKLFEYGSVTLTFQRAAAEYFCRLGQREKARDLARKLKRVAPRLFGLAPVLKALSLE